MATIANVLELMPLVDNELQVGSGGDDEANAILAVGVAQREWEKIVARTPKILQTTGSLSTTANQDYTTMPTGLVRLDGIQPTDATTGRPIGKLLTRILDVGGQAPPSGPLSLLIGAQQSSGRPNGFYATKTQIHWDRVPDAVYTFRYYGFVKAAVATVRGTTFAYDDELLFPFATLAVRILRIGRDDDAEAVSSLAGEVFGSTVQAYRKMFRDRPYARSFSVIHDT